MDKTPIGPQFYAQTSDTMPLFYDEGLGPVYFVDFADDIARRAAAAAPLRVLEVAAGTGIVSRRLRDVLPAETRLVVTDLNPAMLGVARAKFGSEEVIDFQPANALSLPFADESFDALICQFGIMFFPDKDKSCREAHRVLSSGGSYIFSVWDSELYNPVVPLLRNIIARFCLTDPPKFTEVPFTYHEIDPIRDLLDRAGFVGLGISIVAIQKVIDDPLAFARGVIYGSPLVDEFRLRHIDPANVVDALAEALLCEFGSQPTRMPLQAIVFEAQRGI